MEWKVRIGIYKSAKAKKLLRIKFPENIRKVEGEIKFANEINIL